MNATNEELMADALEHLLKMAQHPGFKDHAWKRAKDLAKGWPEVYEKLPELLTAKVKELQA
jgi:hypothetical protein